MSAIMLRDSYKTPSYFHKTRKHLVNLHSLICEKIIQLSYILYVLSNVYAVNP